MDLDHRHFDHVRRRALDRGIDGVALGGAADGRVRGSDVTQVTAPAGDRFHVTVLARELDGVAHVFPDAGELREIMLNDPGGFLAGDAEALGQSEC